MPRLSVIVPVYNAEAHLRICLDSIFGQTVRELEVLCVDDGSTDGSARVLDDYARREPRLKVFRQANAGQGAARNRGLACAHGDYVQFVDADDALASPDACARLLAAMETERLDALFFDAETHFSSDVPDERRRAVHAADYIRKGDYASVMTGPALFAAFLKRREFSPSPCLLMLRRAFLEKARISFPESRIFYEDNVFMTRVLLAAQRASHRPWSLYVRNVWADSTMTSALSVRHFRGRLVCYQDAVALLARDGWDRQTRGVLRERARIYKLHVRRFLDGYPEIVSAARAELSPDEIRLVEEIRRYPLGEKIANGFHCLRDRGLGYTLRRIVRGRGKCE